MFHLLVLHLPALAWLIAQALGLFVVATFVFDAIHWALHQCLNSRSRLLRKLAQPHQAHHDFFDAQLRFHPEATARNILEHVVPEYGTQMAVSAMGLLVLDPRPVVAVMGFFTLLFVGVLVMKGKDRNHIAFEVLPAAHEGVFIQAPYHALHHVHPDNYMSSYTTLFDRVMGTGCQIQRRRVALTGASGALGGPLKELLERDGATVMPLAFGRDYTYDDYSGADAALRDADILILAHGAKGEHAMAANRDSFVALIERFKELTADRRFPGEVWAVGSEIECHPAFGVPELQDYARSKRAFAQHAARYFRDPDILYRHIVPSAFRSRMGPGLMSGRTAARIALFFIRRGFRYVPVTYTGIALLNYLPFVVRSWWMTAPSSLRLSTAGGEITPKGIPVR